MAKIIKEWSEGSVSIAVEAGKDDANRENVHVHVYKRGRRTDARISTWNSSASGIDNEDYEIACKLFSRYLSDIKYYYEKVKNGEYDN